MGGLEGDAGREGVLRRRVGGLGGGAFGWQEVREGC